MLRATFTIDQLSPTSYRVIDSKGAVIEKLLNLKELLVWTHNMAYLGYGIAFHTGFTAENVFKATEYTATTESMVERRREKDLEYARFNHE